MQNHNAYHMKIRDCACFRTLVAKLFDFPVYTTESQAINKDYYLEVLRCLCPAVQRKQPDMWTGKNWQFHHDNASAHSSHVIKGFLANNNTALEQHPPYSPDLAPYDF